MIWQKIWYDNLEKIANFESCIWKLYNPTDTIEYQQTGTYLFLNTLTSKKWLEGWKGSKILVQQD